MSAEPRDVNDFWAQVDAHADARIKIALREFETNYRPRGAASVPLTVGTPGVALVPGLWINGAKVPFPLVITEIHIVADAVSDTTFDLLVQRPAIAGQPAQTVLLAASIVATNYPRLYDPIGMTALQEIVITPSVSPLTTPPVWSSTYLEGNSLVYLSVRSTDGGCNVVTFNIVGRAV